MNKQGYGLDKKGYGNVAFVTFRLFSTRCIDTNRVCMSFVLMTSVCFIVRWRRHSVFQRPSSTRWQLTKTLRWTFVSSNHCREIDSKLTKISYILSFRKFRRM